jgi:Glycosyltransferase (GlcNAc)
MFGPSEALLWHCYGHKDRRVHWEDHPLWHQTDGLSLKRYRHLLEIEPATDPAALVEITEFGLGTVRSLEQYQTFSGINFKAQTLTDFAIKGEWKL